MSPTTETVSANKLEAASRQLDAAIWMLFSGGDPIAVHTLAGAASTIASDLVKEHTPDKSWDKAAQTVNDLSEAEYFRVVRETQNFLKHAKDDPDGQHVFALSDTEALIFWTAMNLGELGQQLTFAQSIYQLWFLALNADVLDPGSELHETATRAFGDLGSSKRVDRLMAGLRKLEARASAN